MMARTSAMLRQQGLLAYRLILLALVGYMLVSQGSALLALVFSGWLSKADAVLLASMAAIPAWLWLGWWGFNAMGLRRLSAYLLGLTLLFWLGRQLL